MSKRLYFPAAPLGENPGRVFYYCPNCFQWKRMTVRTILKFRGIPGSYEVDPGYLRLFLGFMAEKYREIMFYCETDYGNHISDSLRECVNYNIEADLNESDQEKYRDLVYKNAIFFCPNCGCEMISKPDKVIECMELSGCGGCGPYEDLDPPGCYLCGFWPDEVYRDEALLWCVRCFQENNGSVDCKYCIWELAKIMLTISMEEIKNRAKDFNFREDS